MPGHIYDAEELVVLRAQIETVIAESNALKRKIDEALAANARRDTERVNPELRATRRANEHRR